VTIFRSRACNGQPRCATVTRWQKTRTSFPVEYPTASSPQAWATGTPLLALRVLLGLEPVGEELDVDPALPPSIERIHLNGIPGRWGRIDVSSQAKEAVA
jgi:glycogen debranching enzyme